MRHFKVITQRHCTLFCSKKSILNKKFTNIQKWFHDNYMVLNLENCCYMTFGSNTTKNEFVLVFNEDGTTVPSTEEYLVLGITIDSRLTFYSHLK